MRSSRMWRRRDARRLRVRPNRAAFGKESGDAADGYLFGVRQFGKSVDEFVPLPDLRSCHGVTHG
jgi:hypothetical protein